jgi:hypothetical protein
MEPLAIIMTRAHHNTSFPSLAGRVVTHTLGWALIQSSSIAFYLKHAVFDWTEIKIHKIHKQIKQFLYFVIFYAEAAATGTENATKIQGRIPKR